MFILIVLEILLSEGRSVLWPTHQSRGSKTVKVLVKETKKLLELVVSLENWFTYKLSRFRMLFEFFWFFLTLSVREKLKKSIYKMPIITQTLKTNNLRYTSANSINLHTIRKLVEYSLKNLPRRQCLFLTFWRHCCPKVGRYWDLSTRRKGAKGLKFQ